MSGSGKKDKETPLLAISPKKRKKVKKVCPTREVPIIVGCS